MFFFSATKQERRDDEESVGKPMSKALLSKCYTDIYIYVYIKREEITFLCQLFNQPAGKRDPLQLIHL